MPPSIEELERRLRGRASEPPEKIKQRLENAVSEIAYAQEGNGDHFDAIIRNDDIEVAFRDLVKLLQGWFWDLDLYIPDSK